MPPGTALKTVFLTGTPEISLFFGTENRRKKNKRPPGTENGSYCLLPNLYHTLSLTQRHACRQMEQEQDKSYKSQMSVRRTCCALHYVRFSARKVVFVNTPLRRCSRMRHRRRAVRLWGGHAAQETDAADRGAVLDQLRRHGVLYPHLLSPAAVLAARRVRQQHQRRLLHVRPRKRSPHVPCAHAPPQVQHLPFVLLAHHGDRVPCA